MPSEDGNNNVSGAKSTLLFESPKRITCSRKTRACQSWSRAKQHDGPIFPPTAPVGNLTRVNIRDLLKRQMLNRIRWMDDHGDGIPRDNVLDRVILLASARSTSSFLIWRLAWRCLSCR